MHFRYRLSVIVPLAPDDSAWKELLQDLSPLTPDCELLIVGNELPSESDVSLYFTSEAKIRFISSPVGRAIQMNRAAREAKGSSLWFLHADSRLPIESIARVFELCSEIESHRKANTLFYFDLKFQNDGPFLTTLNAIGVLVRCRLFSIPFGDQGFFLAKDLFHKLGGYTELCSYGEDHLLVWQAKRLRIPICATSRVIYTSARKYRQLGWFNVTAKHLNLFAQQAFPQFCLLLRERLGR